MNDFNLSKPRFSYVQNTALNYLIKKSNNILPIAPDFLLQQECCSLQTYQTHSNITNSDIEYLSNNFKRTSILCEECFLIIGSNSFCP